MDNRTAISKALQKAMAYIQDHEDTRNYSKQTPGKMLYTELLALVAMLGSGAASTDEPVTPDHTVDMRDMIPAPTDRLLEAAKAVVEFQAMYEENTGDKMPGNEMYSALLMDVVKKARQAIEAMGTEKL